MAGKGRHGLRIDNIEACEIVQRKYGTESTLRNLFTVNDAMFFEHKRIVYKALNPSGSNHDYYFIFGGQAFALGAAHLRSESLKSNV